MTSKLPIHRKRNKGKGSTLRPTVYDDAAGAGAQPQGDLAQERGERIETGIAIARSGKTSGHVPGATEQSKSR
jgi:hypothetical protein